MNDIDESKIRIPEKDAAGTQLEPKASAEVSDFSSKIPIPPSDRGLASTQSKSKDSPRRGKDAPSPDASGDVKGARSDELLDEIEGPRNNFRIEFKEDPKNLLEKSLGVSGAIQGNSVMFPIWRLLLCYYNTSFD